MFLWQLLKLILIVDPLKKRDACNAFGGGIVCQWDHNPRKQKPGVGECVAFVSKAPTFAPTNKPTTAAPTTLQPTPAPVPCSSFNQKNWLLWF